MKFAHLPFHSAIKGYPVSVLCPQKTSVPSPFNVTPDKHRNIIFTAETHNFPTGQSICQRCQLLEFYVIILAPLQFLPANCDI